MAFLSSSASSKPISFKIPIQNSKYSLTLTFFCFLPYFHAPFCPGLLLSYVPYRLWRQVLFLLLSTPSVDDLPSSSSSFQDPRLTREIHTQSTTKKNVKRQIISRIHFDDCKFRKPWWQFPRASLKKKTLNLSWPTQTCSWIPPLHQYQ